MFLFLGTEAYVLVLNGIALRLITFQFYQVNLFGKLFNLVIDKLLIELEREYLGCHKNRLLLGVIAYADDILLLLTASVLQMHRMLKIYYKFSLCRDLIFNFTKSEWACAGKFQCNSKMELKIANTEL